MVNILSYGYPIETSFLMAKQLDPEKLSYFLLFKSYVGVYFANWYLTKLRLRDYRPTTLFGISIIERLLLAPFSFFIKNKDIYAFRHDDFIIKKQVINTKAAEELAELTVKQKYYYDIYRGHYQQEGLAAPDGPPTLYVKTLNYVRSTHFWDLITEPVLYDTCINILGKRAKITWSWLWHSMPQDGAYQNQNWHRDMGEPFNFIRVFYPLSSIKSIEDGPTVIAQGTSRQNFLYERRRFQEAEVFGYISEADITPVFADKGDIYFANTFCLHRGFPPARPRQMLSLLVSYQNSYRTKGLPRIPYQALSSKQQAFIAPRKRFFMELCDFSG